MNIQEIRKQYPQYNDLSDKELADAFHKKHYSDIPIETFYQRIGLNENQYELTDKNKKDFKATAKDVARSSISGLSRVPAFFAGLPGDINTLGKAIGVPDYLTAPIGELITGKPKKNLFPTSQQIIDYTEQKFPKIKPVTSYVPQTTEGKYAKTITEFAAPGLAGKSKAFTTGLGAGGGLLYQGLEDATQNPLAATGITLPLMMTAGILGRPSTASTLAKDALENVTDAEIKAARALEKTGQDMGINLMPGEVFDNKNIRNLTRDVVSSEKGSPIIYASAKDRRDDVINIAGKQADEIASMPASQRETFDLIGDTATTAIKKAKIDRSITAQKSGYKVANTESLLPEQVFNVINKIDEAIKTLPKSSPNVTKLNQIKNQLIAKKVKVKGKKELEIVPETNINKLDSVFKQFRDDYKRSNKGVASESRFIDKQLGYQLFNETDDAILNTLNKELRTNTNYAQANDKFAKLSEGVVKVIENNVLPLAKGKINETTIKSFIFDPKKNNVADINKTFEILNKTNPEASIQLANIYFRNSMNQAFKMTKQGDDLTQGFKLIDSIAGTGQQRKNFMAVIDNVAKAKGVNSKELKVGFEKMIDVFERTGRVANLNNPGFNPAMQAGRSILKDYAAFYTFNPRVRLATKWGEFKAGRAWEELANVFVKDDSVDALIDLARTNPQSKKAVLRTLYILDTSQGLQSQPLTTEEERQLYLEELTNQ
jgi:hypothetical protein